jgi:hypothetical protein
MRSLTIAAVFAALLVPAIAGKRPAKAGEISGFRCDNECPLAHTANLHRAYGLESLSVSTTVRAESVVQLEKNLARV